MKYKVQKMMMITIILLSLIFGYYCKYYCKEYESLTMWFGFLGFNALILLMFYTTRRKDKVVKDEDVLSHSSLQRFMTKEVLPYERLYDLNGCKSMYVLFDNTIVIRYHNKDVWSGKSIDAAIAVYNDMPADGVYVRTYDEGHMKFFEPNKMYMTVKDGEKYYYQFDKIDENDYFRCSFYIPPGNNIHRNYILIDMRTEYDLQNISAETVLDDLLTRFAKNI